MKGWRTWKYSVLDDYVLDKVLNKIKEITGCEKFDDAKILDDITLKNVVILMACVIKNGDEFYL